MAPKKRNASVIFILFLVVAVTGLLFNFLTDDDTGRDNSVSGHTIEVPKDLTVSESSVFLYFCDRKRPYLVAEERVLSHSENPVLFGKTIIASLISGPHGGGMRSLPEDTELRALYITDDKTAYADFSQEIKESHPGGSQMEHLSVFSIVNSLALNIPEIDKVKILIDGQEIDTLSGHIDIRDPLSANMLLVR